MPEQAAGKIYGEFYQEIRNFIRSRLRDKSQVDDVLHEVFLKIHLNIDSVRDHKKIRSWIFQIARNTIIDFYRSRKPEVELPEEYPAEIKTSGLENGDEILANGLKAVIRLLPSRYAEVLILSGEGLTQKELAEQLRLSLSGVKSRIRRGRKLLDEKLLEFCHFEFDRFGNVTDYRIKKCPICRQKN